jgi:DMSO/TMAO reductase YedYZ molybdopterin-dependent catalytic subunit
MPRREIEGDWVMGWPDRKRFRFVAGKDQEGRIIHARSPYFELEGLITPTDAYYIVAQLEVPEPVHPEDYTFEISGEVDTPITYTLDDLRLLPGHTVRAVTECAGDDTEFWDYLESRTKGGNLPKASRRVSGEGEDINWRDMVARGEIDLDESRALVPSTCLVSGGEWTGIRLSEVLNRAGVKDTAVAIRVEGFDRGRPDPSLIYRAAGHSDFEVVDPGVINYDKGLPIEKAMESDTILAWAHNGEFLTHIHGAPLRMVVPGWAGNWWVKWIHKIEVMDHMPNCYHQTQYFVSGKSPDDPNKVMMTALGVKTVITEPRDEESPLPKGRYPIRGLAWSGEGRMERVEVSTDGGETWNDAHLEDHGDRYLWRRWSYPWEASKSGHYVLMARGTDEKGRRQPVTEWNYQRKHFDGIVPVDIEIE